MVSSIAGALSSFFHTMAVTCSDTIIEVVMDHSKEIPVLSGHHQQLDISELWTSQIRGQSE